MSRFSEAGPRLVDDKRNFLYLHFIRCLMQSKPKIFVAENVKGMMTLGKGEVFKQIIQDFAAAGYTIYHKLLNSAEYGVPQIRERVILVGVRNDINFEYVHPEATHGYGVKGLKEVVTLRDAIGDLEDDPGDYFTGSYSTILCPVIVKNFGHSQALRFRHPEDRHRFILLESLW